MKKSMITMCIAALTALYMPAVASETGNTPPVKQEIRVIDRNILDKHTRNEAKEAPVDKEDAAGLNGNENSSESRHSGGYVVISGAGLLLIIILLILLL